MARLDEEEHAVATRADVARLAGVSTSTVSYAISGARPITAATRSRIEAAMRELGYTPNVLASGLAGRRTRILALLFPFGPRGLEGADLQYVVAAADLARERGYHLVLWTLGDGGLGEVGRFSGSGLVDGVLLMEVRLADERVRFLQSAAIPLALIGRTADPEELAYADADFEQIMRLAVDHLAGLGHRRVGLLSAGQPQLDLGNGSSVRVPEAASRAAADAGVRLVTLACGKSVAAGRTALSGLWERLPGLTAVVSSNWEAAVGVLQRATAQGLRIPDDLSVLAITGCADRAEITTPSLTTIRPPAADIARAAAAALIDQLERPDIAPTRLLLPGTLHPGGSTGPASR
jgi:DNA-binding LacI/PurR family transcriptional regulator